MWLKKSYNIYNSHNALLGGVFLAGGKEKAVQFLMKAKKTIQRIIRAIKFFATPLGTVLGWILFILFAVLLLYVVVETVATSFKDLLGFNTDYVTYDEDK